jgi:Na+/H+ antiporter NhaD/arsenite permease-like protein
MSVPTLLAAAASGPIPLWSVAPFAVLLLGIAVLPLVAHHWWESNRNKAIVALLLALPMAGWLMFGLHGGGGLLAHSLIEYVAFIALLGSLFVITGGIYLRGSLAGTPLVNTAMLGIGAVLASFVGTTGASMLLIRPLLRANEKRQRKTHLVIFFIFIVSNAGGMLTPLGDPPLFLGFLKGVPFAWTFGLTLEWAVVCGALLVIFHVWDQVVLNREERERPGSQLEEVQQVRVPLSLEGKVNLIWLLGVIGVILGVGTLGTGLSDGAKAGLQAAGMLALALASLATTPTGVRAANRFGYGPIIEVAVIFVGIFVTMVPALELVRGWGSDGTIQLTEPWQYFWATGGLSSFLDNAPTYLVFASLAKGAIVPEGGDSLAALVASPLGNQMLMAIACGAVFMGANTYIGNGPNFMVKAIAEENKVKMPSFFGYMLWSVGILIPLFLLVTVLFFL